MKLLDRIILGNILPKQGSFTDLVLAEDIKTKTKITQEEIKEYEVKQEGLNLKWSVEGGKKEFEYEFTELEKVLIKKQLEELNKTAKLGVDMVNLYKEFVNK